MSIWTSCETCISSERNMGLSTVEKNVYIFLDYFFFYLYRFPLQWDTEYTCFSISKPCFPRLIPFLVVIIYSFAYAVTCILTAIYFHPRSNFKIVEHIILFLTFYAIAFVVLVVFVIFANINVCMDFCNETMEMASRIKNGEFNFF